MGDKTFNGVKLYPTWVEASTRANITSGENLVTSFGKIQRYFDDLQPVAFSGDYKDLRNKPVEFSIYGIKVDKNNSDPATRVTYTDNAVGMTPARMDYTNNVFNLGSWGNVFFVRDNYPAMVTFAGKIDYKLSPTNHAYKEDGVTASDVANTAYNGNAMSVFDCMIWIKAWEDTNYEYYQIANYQADNDFKAYPYYKPDGSMAKRLYYPMYKGSYYDGKLRSLSGSSGKPAKFEDDGTTPKLSIQNNVQLAGASKELEGAQACGSRWSICDYAHRVWLSIMLLVMSCHDNFKVAFGNGNQSGYSSAASDVPSGNQYGWHNTGYLDTAGQFFGYGSTVVNKPVKVFYIEDWWGKRWDRCLGCWNVSGSIKIKWTPPYSASTSEGETTGITVPSTNWQITTSPQWGRFPTSTGSRSSATKYNCSYFYSNNSGDKLSFFGGHSLAGSRCSSWSVLVNNAAAYSSWDSGASPYLIDPDES